VKVSSDKEIRFQASIVELSKYKIEWLLLVFGLLSISVSIYFDLCSINSTTWFARSGAIVVLVAAIVEFRLASYSYEDIYNAAIQTARKKASTPSVSDNPMVNGLVQSNLTKKPEAPLSRKILSVVSHIFVILGTAVWGYGDLLVS